MTALSELTELGEQERKAIVLAAYYEEVRRRRDSWYVGVELRHGQLVLRDATFRTIRDWFEEQRWDIGGKYRRWQEYIEFVFDRFSPEIPFPGQLKNKLLLKKYLQAPPDREKDKRQGRSDADLMDIYRRVLDPEMAEDYIRSAFG